MHTARAASLTYAVAHTATNRSSLVTNCPACTTRWRSTAKAFAVRRTTSGPCHSRSAPTSRWNGPKCQLRISGMVRSSPLHLHMHGGKREKGPKIFRRSARDLTEILSLPQAHFGGLRVLLLHIRHPARCSRATPRRRDAFCQAQQPHDTYRREGAREPGSRAIPRSRALWH